MGRNGHQGDYVFKRSAHWSGVLYDGIFNEYGEGGPLCMQYIPTKYKVYDTILYVVSAIIILSSLWGAGVFHHVPVTAQFSEDTEVSRKLLLYLTVLVYISQVWIKLTTRQGLFLLNNCHMLLLVQIVLLWVQPSVWTSLLFTLMFHMLFLPQLAILAPHLGNNASALEYLVYWLEHIAILYWLPPYFITQIGYSPFCLGSWNSQVFSVGALLFHYFGVIQQIGWVYQMNICFVHGPTPGDPMFGHPNIYRTGHVIIHILCIFLYPLIYLRVMNSFVDIFSPWMK